MERPRKFQDAGIGGLDVQRLSRRNMFSLVSAGALIGACSDNPTTGRRQLLLVSDEDLVALGAEAWRDVKAQMAPVADAAMQRRLERIGAAVAGVSAAPEQDWEFLVFDRPDINAFVLPGGKVGFFRGLMDAAESDDEIAAIVGHEIGHVEARHAAERMSQQAALQIGVSLAAMALAEEYGQHAQTIAGALGAGALYGVILPYSRMQELEADALGVNLMKSAGFDAAGALSFWRRMAGDGAGALEWMSTHPADGRRLMRLEELAGQ